MSERPTVSVVVPCFNQGRFLGEALDCVLAQTFADWECIVVDDGSTDETGTVARAYADVSPRFRLLEQPNRGLSAARNAALDVVRGAYVQFLDADDLIPPERLAAMLEAVRDDDGLTLAYSDYCFMTREPPARRIERPQSRPYLDPRRPLLDMARRWEGDLSIPVHAFFIDARLFAAHGVRFDERLVTHEDWDCWMQILRFSPRIIHVARELAVYRIGAGNLSQNLERMREGFLAACDKQLARSSGDAELVGALRAKKEAVRNYYNAKRFQRMWATLPSLVQNALLERTHWRIAAAIESRLRR